MRRHRHDHELRLREGGSQVSGRCKCRRQLDAGEVHRIFPGRGHLRGEGEAQKCGLNGDVLSEGDREKLCVNFAAAR